MQNLERVDAEAAAVQKTPNRVTLDDLRNEIAGEYTFTLGDVARGLNLPVLADMDITTLHVCVLRNGFTTIGTAASADRENFNAEFGARRAREKAVEQIWPLLGFRMRDRLLVQPQQSFAGGESDQRKTGIVDLPKDQQEQLDRGDAITPRPDAGAGSPPPSPDAPAGNENRDVVDLSRQRPADTDGARG